MLLNFITRNRNIVFAFPFLIYFISLFNQWHFQDDHEIALFTTYLKNHSFLETLKLTEVFQWSEFKRFRPSYYTLRIFESQLWGTNLYLWYVVRLLIQFFFLKEVLSWAKRILTINEAYLVTLLMVSFLFWRDLQPRLGPGETYCVLGVALISYALRTGSNKFIYFLGAFIAIGSKENFITTPLLISFFLIRNNNFKKTDYIIQAFLGLFSLFIAIGIYKAISATGGDIYMTKVDPYSRALGLLKGLLSVQIIPYLVIAIAFLRKKITLSGQDWTLLLMTSFVLVTNIFFYSGKIPNGSRYDFPSVPFNLIAWVILYQKFTLTNFRKLILIAIVIITASGIYRQVTKSITRHKSTIAFTKSLQHLANTLKDEPTAVLVTNSTNDYEPILFIPRYLTHMNIKTNFYFLSLIEETSNPYKRSLKNEMDFYSKNGTKTEFSPWPTTIPECVQVNFSSSISKETCKKIINF